MQTGIFSAGETEVQVTPETIRNALLLRPALASSDTPSLAQVQNALPLPAEARRNGGWAKYSDRVVVVNCADGKISILAGHICSTPGSHLSVDNVSKVVVWFDEPYRLADDADDAYERAFDVADPHLFLAGEIGLVRYSALARLWFGNTYTDQALDQIRTAVASFVPDQTKQNASVDFAFLGV